MMQREWANTFTAMVTLSFLFGLSPPASAVPAGLPKNPLFALKCGICHRPQKDGRVLRLESMRKSPEGWERSIRRMERFQRVKLQPGEREALLKLLCQSLILAPAESRKVFYALAGKDPREEIPPGKEKLKEACVRCHSYAIIAAQRRTREEWLKLKPFHLSLYPALVYQLRDIDWPAVSGEVLESLAKDFPLETPEWRAWRKRQARASTENLAGSWRVIGSQPGRGSYVGSLELKSLGDGDYEVKRSVRYEGGQEESWMGKGTLYGGYALRAYFSIPGGRTKGTFNLSIDGRSLEGSWLSLEKPHLSGDETAHRLGTGEPKVLSLSPGALKQGSSHIQLTLQGINLPTSPGPADIHLGQGIAISKILKASPEQLVVEVMVEGDAPIGERNVTVGKASGKGMLVVYDRVDYLQVVPELGLARVGGQSNPAKAEQFEAIAYNRGPDGTPRTRDDLRLGPVKAHWSVEEYFYSPEDRDVEFVGKIDPNGLFLPSAEGPNPQRPFKTNNVGNVWVVATYRPDGTDQELKAKAFLLVTVQLFLQETMN